MKLNDIAEFVTDKISSSSISLDRYVTTDSLLQNRRGRETAQNLPPMPCALTHYRQGDVLIANIRPYLKKVWYADSEGGCSSDVLAFRAKNGHCPSFLYTVLMQDAFFDYAMSGAKGSKMPRGDKDQIMRYELPTFTPMEEENIGNMMVDIMSKINVNRQINDNLEAMAKQLYDYWFVQFDFPNEEGKPYKSSGGAMVWNEKLKREIPQGWGTQNLADCLKLKTERVNSKDIKDTDNYTPIEVIPRKQMSLHETVALENAMSGICRYSRRNILLSNRRVYFHKVCIAPFDGLTRDTVLVLEPYNSGNLGYLYETVFADEFILFATKHSYGSEQPVLSWTAAQKFNVLRPSYSIDKKYSEIVDSIIESVLNNQIEIIKLTKQRDELLPLLMNGQATVNYHLSLHLSNTVLYTLHYLGTVQNHVVRVLKII